MYKVFLTLLILIAICCESCQTKKGNCITNYYVYGIKESEGCYVGSSKDGIWKYYYPNGKINAIVHYLSGQKNGQSLEYDKNGRISSDATYKNGHFFGIVKFYYPNGNVNTEEYYDEKGLNRGAFKLWYPSGRISQTGNFVNGKMVGIWLQYYESGKIKSNSHYDSLGKKDSIWMFYSVNGSLIKKEKYKADSLIQK